MSCAWYPITSLLATPSSDRRRLTVSRSVPFSFASLSRSLPFSSLSSSVIGGGGGGGGRIEFATAIAAATAAAIDSLFTIGASSWSSSYPSSGSTFSKSSRTL